MSMPGAIEQVQKMAHDPDWTARLFAAACLWKYRELKDPELIEQLGNDEHELVRKIAQELEHATVAH
jgi:hypothetical protein